jgi:hypothetical protein
MASDATAQLIQRIRSQLPPGGAATQDASTNFLSQVGVVVANAAGYAQILSTAAGPIAQAAVASQLGNIAAQQTAGPIAAGAAAQAAALAEGATAESAAAASTAATAEASVTAAGAGAAATALAGAATAGIAAAAVLIVSFLLAALSSNSGSSETQQLNRLAGDIKDIEDAVLAAYWQDKLLNINTLWSALGTDLDNLANEGTGGIDVLNDVTHFHDNALGFINSFLPAKSPGAEVYWARPIVQSLLFSAQDVAYFDPLSLDPPAGHIQGWYGAPPRPGLPAGSSGQQMASDPGTMLPFLLLGIESYLTLEALIHAIDTKQPTFNDFLTQFRGDIKDYASFIYSQYQLAINGIVKSDLPSNADVSSYLWFIAGAVDGVLNYSSTPSAAYIDNGKPWGSESLSVLRRPSAPHAGFAWNGVYGVVNVYPQYGAYQPSPPVPVPSNSPSYIIDVIDTSDFATLAVSPSGYTLQETLNQWFLPWVENRLILGRMARWKAIFLFNGYDKVWSILQHLRVLSAQPLLPTPKLDQDGTIANGDWSMRELISVMNFSADIARGLPSTVVPEPRYLNFLVLALDNIAKGSWAGYPTDFDSQSMRPIGFRATLAAAAV